MVQLSSNKTSIVRFSFGNDKFEIIVKSDAALDYKLNKRKDIENIVVADEVYADSSKGLKASREKLKKAFKTEDLRAIQEIIMQRGELSLTTEQRRKMAEDKRKQIIAFISKNFIDPHTGLPHPPIRVEQALNEIDVSIDPFKPAEEQTKLIIEKLRPILALKTGNIKIQVRIPAVYTSQAVGVLKSFGQLIKEEWLSDGGLDATMQIPIAMQSTLLDRIASLTHGNAQIKVIE